MRKRFLFIAPLILLLVSNGAFAQSDTTVKTSNSPDFGTYLTDQEGRSLYVFFKDEPNSGKSNCNGQCADKWPPFTADDPLTLPDGVPGELTQITRDDGTMQVAYNGWPLYYYDDDDEPGDTYGQNVGGVWYLATPVEPGATPAASPMASPVASPAATPEY